MINPIQFNRYLLLRLLLKQPDFYIALKRGSFIQKNLAHKAPDKKLDQ